MVDTKSFNKIDAAAQKTNKLVEMGAFTKATEEWANTQQVIFEETNNIDFYNILTKLKFVNHSSIQNDASSLPRGIQAINIITFYFIKLY